jgi:hypothetical protein
MIYLNYFKRYISRYSRLELVGIVFTLLMSLWLILSYMDIVANNLSTYTYAKWNIIILLSNIF